MYASNYFCRTHSGLMTRKPVSSAKSISKGIYESEKKQSFCTRFKNSPERLFVCGRFNTRLSQMFMGETSSFTDSKCASKFF